MRKKFQLAAATIILFAAIVLLGCTNANQTKTVAGKFYRDVSISIYADYG